MTAAEFYVYVVAFMCGVSMLMPISAVFSAPSYMLRYYLFATKNPHHVPTMPNFWSNVMTYYNLIGLVTGLVMEPLTLLKGFRRIPMLFRLLGGLIILIVEIIVLMAVPARGTSENGAVATLCCAGFIGGFGKSIFESTVYGMFGAFPPSFTSTMMGGVGISGALTSLIQIIVKAALPDTYEGIKKQSYIYYGLDVGIQGATFVALLLLRCNDFAKYHFGDLGGVKSKVDAGSLAGHVQHREPGAEAEEMEGEHYSEPAVGQIQEKGEEVKKDDPLGEGEHSDDNEDSLCVVEVPTSNKVLRSTNVWEVFKSVKWMFIALAFDFLITLFLFPTIATSMFPDWKWFATVAVFVFNCCDVIGRWSPSLKFLWPRTYRMRWIIVALSFARVVFGPLLLSYLYINSEAYGYVMEVIFALTSGYVASMSLVLGLQSKGIDNDGKRFVAGTLMGIAILVGGTISTVLSIMTQTVREKY